MNNLQQHITLKQTVRRATPLQKNHWQATDPLFVFVRQRGDVVRLESSEIVPRNQPFEWVPYYIDVQGHFHFEPAIEKL